MDTQRISMTDKEMKQVMLNILESFTEFCENNNLNYFLDAGTLLGAIRHQGFIPWDDDIDVNMPREDYDNFCKIVRKNRNRISEHYYVEFPDDTIYPFLKIADDRTVLIEFPDKNPMECGVYIDIFPKDGLIGDGWKSKTLCNISRFLHLWQWFNKYSIYAWRSEKSKLKRIVSWIGRKCIKNPNLPIHIQTKLIAQHNKKYKREQFKYVTTLVNGEYSNRALKECFDGYFMGEFEGKYFRVPNGYDMYLRGLYPGDYMQLPPENKRYHHDNRVYWKDEQSKIDFISLSKE